MTVPVSVPVDHVYELNRNNLEKMWEVYASRLLPDSLEVKQNIVLIKGKRKGSILIPNFQYLRM
jgi:hypothetical protein